MRAAYPVFSRIVFLIPVHPSHDRISPKRADQMRIGLTKSLVTGGALCGLTLQAATFTTIDVPGAVITDALSINNPGAIAGYYQDPTHNSHAFVRAPDGTITTFDVPGAGNASAFSINTAGA